MTVLAFPAPRPTTTTTHSLAPRFDAHALTAFRSMVAEVQGDLVLDLGAVRFIDVAGLNLLLEIRAALVDRGHELWIDNASTTAQVTLELAGLDEAFPSLATMQAVAA